MPRSDSEGLEEKELFNAWRRFSRRCSTLVERANDFHLAISPLQARVALIIEAGGQYWLYSTSDSDWANARFANIPEDQIKMRRTPATVKKKRSATFDLTEERPSKGVKGVERPQRGDEISSAWHDHSFEVALHGDESRLVESTELAESALMANIASTHTSTSSVHAEPSQSALQLPTAFPQDTSRHLSLGLSQDGPTDMMNRVSQRTALHTIPQSNHNAAGKDFQYGSHDQTTKHATDPTHRQSPRVLGAEVNRDLTKEVSEPKSAAGRALRGRSIHADVNSGATHGSKRTGNVALGSSGTLGGSPTLTEGYLPSSARLDGLGIPRSSHALPTPPRELTSTDLSPFEREVMAAQSKDAPDKRLRPQRVNSASANIDRIRRMASSSPSRRGR